MASSRLEKIGTIYTRATGLLKSGAMKWDDRPLWYDIYEAFPPKDEPRFDRRACDIPVKSIFYKEDVLRAQYHQQVKPGMLNLFNDSKTKTRRFLEEFNKIETTEHLPKVQIFEMAVSAISQEMVGERKMMKETEKGSSLAQTFKVAQQEHKKVDLTKIMKDE